LNEAPPGSGPFAGKASGIHRDGKSYSLLEHPFMFVGRMQKGTSLCDESMGFTFANVKSLGTSDGSCQYDVQHDDADRLTTMSAHCNALREGIAVMLATSLAVSDDVVGTQNGGAVRDAIFVEMRLTDVPGTEPDGLSRSCTYVGHVLPRPVQ
jgi:hypothetical protein